MANKNNPNGLSEEALDLLFSGMRRISFGLFHARVVETLVKQKQEQEIEQQLPTGASNSPTSWEDLEKLLGKEAVANMKGGQ